MTALLREMARSRTIEWCTCKHTHTGPVYFIVSTAENLFLLSPPLLTQRQQSCVAINRSGQRIKKPGKLALSGTHGRDGSPRRGAVVGGRRGAGWNKLNCRTLWLSETQFLRPRAVVARCARRSRPFASATGPRQTQETGWEVWRVRNGGEGRADGWVGGARGTV